MFLEFIGFTVAVILGFYIGWLVIRFVCIKLGIVSANNNYDAPGTKRPPRPQADKHV